MSLLDFGRKGLRRFGVPIGGVMDQSSALYANSLSGVSIDSPVIEMYQPGHILKFHTPVYFCLCGAKGDYSLDGLAITTDTLTMAEGGSQLKIGKMTKGSRLYLSIRGVFQIEKKLGSISPLPGYDPPGLTKGTRIPFEVIPGDSRSSAKIRQSPLDLDKEIHVYRGPEWSSLDRKTTKHLLESIYDITSQSNRMGYRLKGQKILGYRHRPILSSSVMPGTVQLLPSGLPLILMRDGATTGGYPRIFQVIPKHINKLSSRYRTCLKWC